MEVGCLRNPGAHPPLAASSEMETAPMVLLPTQPRVLTHRGNTGTHHTNKTVECEGRYAVVGKEPKLKKVPTSEEMLMIQEHVESWCTCTFEYH